MVGASQTAQADVVVDPDDPDRDERDRVGRLRRPLVPKLVAQGALHAWNMDV
ncbi:MAG TPA: hypothetical protein VE983_07535 [Solirubrobacteraceae bacterium]|nr:hypothetical protein [Solirubrobacteraceae bacterium]